jgi:hypothetical protein
MELFTPATTRQYPVLQRLTLINYLYCEKFLRLLNKMVEARSEFLQDRMALRDIYKQRKTTVVFTQ